MVLQNPAYLSQVRANKLLLFSQHYEFNFSLIRMNQSRTWRLVQILLHQCAKSLLLCKFLVIKVLFSFSLMPLMILNASIMSPLSCCWFFSFTLRCNGHASWVSKGHASCVFSRLLGTRRFMSERLHFCPPFGILVFFSKLTNEQ